MSTKYGHKESIIDIARSNAGDWVGFYVNGELVEEGHSFRSDWLQHIVGSYVKDVRDVDVEAWALEEHWAGRMPDKFDSLQGSLC